MSRYINADKKLTITIYDAEHEEDIDQYMTIEEILDTYTSEGCPPTADVVDIVRCKDCINWQTDWYTSYDGYHYCSMIDIVIDGDFYCKDGERKILQKD